ncbi:MAG: endo-1,3-alpha-glucanase family glycosylhydrolase [Phycisphaeraceae bacterium]
MEWAGKLHGVRVVSVIASVLTLLIVSVAGRSAEGRATTASPAAEGPSTQYHVRDAADLAELPVLKGGDVVVLAPGVYDDVTLTFEAVGASEEHPVHIFAQPLGGAVFTGETRLVLKGDWITLAGLRFENGGPGHLEGAVKFDNGSSHCRLTNCSFRAFDQDRSNANWVFLRGYEHRVDHCLFEGKTSSNATMAIKPNDNPNEEEGPATPRRHRIDHNYFGRRDVEKNNGYETIRIGDSSKQTFDMACIVERNYFYQAIKADDAGEMEIISNKSRGNIYRNNVFEDCDGQLTLRHGQACVVEGNWFLGTGGKRQSGVRVIGSGHIIRRNYFHDVDGSGLRSALCVMDGKYGDDTSNRYEAVEGVAIEENLFENCRHPVNLGESKGPVDPPRDVTFMNNRIVSNENSPLFNIEKDVRFANTSGNRVHNATGNYGPLPPGTEVEHNLAFDPGEWPVDADACKPEFAGGPAGTYEPPTLSTGRVFPAAEDVGGWAMAERGGDVYRFNHLADMAVSRFASNKSTILASGANDQAVPGALAPMLALIASWTRAGERAQYSPGERGLSTHLQSNRPVLDRPIADERLVIAHYMTGMLPTPAGETDRWMNPDHYDPHGATARIGGMDQTLPVPMLLFPDLLSMQDAALLEMTTAQSLGVDGFNFYYPFGPNAAFRDRYDKLILAFFEAAEAHDLDFKLTLCFAPHGGVDMTASEKIDEWGMRLRALIERTQHSEKWLRTPDGRHLFYTWVADGMVSDALDGRHWEIREHPELLKNVAAAFDQIATRARVEGAFLYHLQFPADCRFLHRALDYFPAVTGWVNAGEELAQWRRVAAVCRDRNRTYVQEVHPDYYSSKTYERGNGALIFKVDRVLSMDRERLERHAQVLGLTHTFRDKLQMAIELDSPLINFTTWNDYPEGHHLAPEINHNFGFSLLLRHYLAIWRGQPEKGPRDVAIVFFKKYPAHVTPAPFDIAVRYIKKVDAPASEDGIEVITILDDPGQLRVNGHAPQEVPAGLSVTRYPMQPGSVDVEVTRNRATIVSFTTPESITFQPYRTDRLTYSFSSEFQKIYGQVYGPDAPLHTSMEYAENEAGEPQWRRNTRPRLFAEPLPHEATP